MESYSCDRWACRWCRQMQQKPQVTCGFWQCLYSAATKSKFSWDYSWGPWWRTYTSSGKHCYFLFYIGFFVRLRIIVMCLLSLLFFNITSSSFILSTNTSIARPTTLHNVIFHLPSKLGALHHCIQVYEWFYNVFTSFVHSHNILPHPYHRFFYSTRYCQRITPNYHYIIYCFSYTPSLHLLWLRAFPNTTFLQYH